MHCHTREGSIDAHVPIGEYAAILKSKGFGGMLVTDHDSYRGYYYAKEHPDKMPKNFEIIRGIEYDTKDAGHYLVIMPDSLYLRQLEFRGMKVETLIELVHANGGVLGPAHPFGMQGASAMYFHKMRSHPEILERFDFLEGLNTCEKVISNKKARELAEEYHLCCTGGSDSHVAKYVGTAFTSFDREIHSADDMIEAFKDGGVAAFGGKEREYLRRHAKRNWFITTWSFKLYNYGLSTLYAPYHHQKLKKTLHGEV